MTQVTLLLIAPVALPALAAGGHAAFGRRPGMPWLSAVAAAGVLAAAIGLAVLALDRPRAGLSGLLRADALTAVMLIVIGAVALLAMAASPAYLAGERAAGHMGTNEIRRYGILTQGFVAAMALAVLASSLGVFWVAIEATTIFTAFLVGHRRTRSATEAAWKYVVICSTGIALALLGIMLLHFAALHAHVPAGGALDWTRLAAHATDLDRGVTRIAIALLILGFGTKAGLAPMHAWLPDAHSQAPAPVSALMSGVLLSVAFYGVLRIKVIADAALGTGFARLLLLTVGLASLAVAAALLIAQRDFKRMLAYSSIEHMGLLTVGAAIGTRAALAAVLLHVLGHGLAKSVAFITSGHIQRLVGGSAIASVRGLFAHAPFLAGAFATAVVALLGFPPFSLFVSELGIFRAGFSGGLGWAVAVTLALMLIVMAALAAHTIRMLLGAPVPASVPTPVPEPVPAMTTAADASATADARATTSATTAKAAIAKAAAPGPAPSTVIVLLAGLTACAVLGIVAWPLDTLLHAAATLIGGAR